MKNNKSNNFFRGYKANITKQMLSVRSRMFVTVFMPVICMLAAGIGSAFLPKLIPRDMAAIAVILIVAALFVPLFSCKTISKERSEGQHFALTEFNHRRGIIIVGQFSADTILCLIYAAIGWAAHVYASTLIHGYIYGIIEVLMRELIIACAIILICAVNTCASAYSKHRAVSYILIIILAGCFAGASVLMKAGVAFFLGWLSGLLMIIGAGILVLLSYTGYRVRTRAER